MTTTTNTTNTTNTTKKYELTVLVDEEATDKDIETMTKRVEKYGKITKFNDEGVKRLGYSIRGREKAHYLFYEMAIEGDNWRELYSDFNIDDNILRYLLIRAGK